MSIHFCWLRRGILFTLGMLAAALPAWGSGFGIFTQGASALGQGNAVTAHVDGPSAVFFNPALLANLPGTQVEVGTTAVVPERSFTSAANGQKVKTKDKAYFPSTFYLTHRISQRFSAGLGVFNPFGLGTRWPDSWEGEFLATRSEVTTFDVNPVLCLRANDRLSLAAGLDVLYLDARLERKIDGSPLQLPPFGQKFTGTGTGVGYNLGLLLHLSRSWTVGVSYRSRISVDVKGHSIFALPGTAASSPQIRTLFPDTGASTKIKLPRQLTVGLALQATERLTLEGDVRWEQWRSFDALRIQFDQPVAGATESIQRRNWHNSLAFDIGMRYRLNSTFNLLAGYLYSDNPVPGSTFEPSIPDSNTQLVSLGTDINLAPFRLSLAYALQMQKDRRKGTNIYGSTANGLYETTIHLIAVSLGYRF